MISSRTQLFVLLLFVVAALGACDPGEATSWSDIKDSGAEDVLSGDDANSAEDVGSIRDGIEEPPDAHQPDVADITETPEATTPPDTATPEEPDATEPDPVEPDVSEPEPDITEPEEPEPPSWNCSAVSCNEVDVSTSLGSMRDIDACAFELALQRPISEGKALADRLLTRLQSESLGTPRSFNYVTDNLNRDGRSGLSSATNTRLSGLNPKGFRWNTGDDNVTYWYPQGITGSSDAQADGKVNGRRFVMNAWYHKTTARPTKGARLALADITDPSNIKYRLLLLVDPIEDSSGKPTYREAAYDSGNALHAGGIVWYGDYLFVADTSQGFRVYDLSRIFSPTKYDSDKVGIHGGESYAHGYRFAVPRIARYRWKSGSCKAKFSFLGLDRTSNPPALVNGGYDSSDHSKKLVVWPLDPATHLLEERGGTTRASNAAIIGQTRAQGAIRANGYYYVSSSSQDGSNGRLYKGRPGQSNTSVKWVYGAEDIYLQRDANRIWTGAEHPGRRDVVSIPLP